jgi:hypothetical protein
MSKTKSLEKKLKYLDIPFSKVEGGYLLFNDDKTLYSLKACWDVVRDLEQEHSSLKKKTTPKNLNRSEYKYMLKNFHLGEPEDDFND